ncbi:MAG: hypothetical protein ACR2GU_10095 [Rubrobacteraceae bacterium]
MDAAWSGDHLTTDLPLLESTVALITAAAVTGHIRVGYGVMLLALVTASGPRGSDGGAGRSKVGGGREKTGKQGAAR